MSELMLYSGGEVTPRNQLGNVVLPPETKSYMPLAHDHFVDIVEDKMASAGFRFVDEVHALHKDGARYFGLTKLVNGRDNDQHHLMLGLRNSLDKKFPAQIVLGAQVIVCSNLSFTGAQKASRKHTVNLLNDLPERIEECVRMTRHFQVNQELRFESYKLVTLKDRFADHLIVEMYRRNIINTARMGTVIDQFNEPDHDFGGRTPWRLFNAVTESLKGSPLHDMPRRTIELQSMMDEVSGFVPEAVH